MTTRFMILVGVIVAALLGLGAWLYGPWFWGPLVVLLGLMGLVEGIKWLLRPRAEKPPAKPPQPPPIPLEELRGLFEFLDRPDPPECTHALKETEGFLKSRNLPVAPTVEWLKANGGFCDCEVIMNVADGWGDKVGWVPTDEGDGPR